jgi:nucleoside-diphosphate-sugar epimerase
MELLERGLPVRAVNRRGAAEVPNAGDVERVAADASDAGLMREVCAGASVVYHCVNPPLPRWRTVFPEVTRSLAAAAGDTGAVLVFADDTWMYGRVSGSMTEDLPARPVSNLGVLRAWFAEMLLAAHRRGEVQVAIARAGELYGPRMESLLGRNLFGQVLSGRRPVWPGNPDLPITPTYIRNFARGLATVAAEPKAWGGVLARTQWASDYRSRLCLQRVSRARSAGAPVVTLQPYRPLTRPDLDGHQARCRDALSV